MDRENAALAVAVCMMMSGCVGIVGLSESIAQWEEQTFPSRVDQSTATRVAAASLAKIGKVQSSDFTTGVINGECKQFLEASVIISDRNGKNYVTVKSRYNVELGALVIDYGDRMKCVQQIAQELRTSGVID